MADALQYALAQTPTGGVLVVEPGEHRTNVVVDRPMTIVGRGALTHLQGQRGTGPTIHIRARGVVLEDLGIEHLQPGEFAILADPGTDPVCIGLDVYGGKLGGVVVRPRGSGGPPGMMRSRPRTTSLTGPVRAPSGSVPPPGGGPAGPALAPSVPMRHALGPPARPAHTPSPSSAPAGPWIRVWIPSITLVILVLIPVVLSHALRGNDPQIEHAPVLGPAGPRDNGEPVQPQPPPAPARIEFIGWDSTSRDGVVDVTYADAAGSLVLRGVFDPRNDVVARFGGPGLGVVYRREQRGLIGHPTLLSAWERAQPAREYRVQAIPAGRGAMSPDGAIVVTVDAERRAGAGGLIPVDVEATGGGYRVTWRRSLAGTGPAPRRRSSIRESTRNLVTFHAVVDGVVWDLLPLGARLEDRPDVDVRYQDVEFHWGNDRVLITVNESTAPASESRAWYYARSAGPQIKILYPPGDATRGHAVADRIERDTRLTVTTVAANSGVRRGIFYRVRTDPVTGGVRSGDARHRAIVERLQAVLRLPEVKEDPSKGWTDVLIVP